LKKFSGSTYQNIFISLVIALAQNFLIRLIKIERAKMEIISGTTIIILGGILLVYFIISCYVIFKGNKSVYLSSEKKKKRFTKSKAWS